MSRRLTASVTALALSIAALVSPAAMAKDIPAAETGSGGALLEALSRVPSTTAARAAPLSYLDQAALVAARPGAARPASLAEALTVVEADDPAARLWLAALMGASSGDMGLLRDLPQATGWPEALGFDLLDVEQHLTFGTPPSDGSVLLGSFDPGAVTDAFATRDYTAQGVRRSHAPVRCRRLRVGHGRGPHQGGPQPALRRRDRPQRAVGRLHGRHPELGGPGDPGVDDGRRRRRGRLSGRGPCLSRACPGRRPRGDCSRRPPSCRAACSVWARTSTVFWVSRRRRPRLSSPSWVTPWNRCPRRTPWPSSTVPPRRSRS